MAWKDLSMKERAAYIRIGVRNGLTDIDSILKAYNSFADGGTEENIYNFNEWDKIPNLETFTMNDKDILDFYRYDFLPRFNKYNGDDSNIADNTLNTTIWEKNNNLPYSGLTTKLIPILHSGNKAKISLNEGTNTNLLLSAAHELSHAIRFLEEGLKLGINNDYNNENTNWATNLHNLLYGTGFNNLEAELLKRAYPLYTPASYLIDLVLVESPIREAGASNTELRFRIFKDLKNKLNRIPTLQETDNYINSLSPEELRNYFRFDSNAYLQLLDKDYIINPEDAKNILGEKKFINPDNVKKALILVAQNDNNLINNRTNFAALGGPININNPIQNYTNNPYIGIPAVRYDYGGNLFDEGGTVNSDNLLEELELEGPKKYKQTVVVGGTTYGRDKKGQLWVNVARPLLGNYNIFPHNKTVEVQPVYKEGTNSKYEGPLGDTRFGLVVPTNNTPLNTSKKRTLTSTQTQTTRTLNTLRANKVGSSTQSYSNTTKRVAPSRRRFKYRTLKPILLPEPSIDYGDPDMTPLLGLPFPEMDLKSPVWNTLLDPNSLFLKELNLKPLNNNNEVLTAELLFREMRDDIADRYLNNAPTNVPEYKPLKAPIDDFDVNARDEYNRLQMANAQNLWQQYRKSWRDLMDRDENGNIVNYYTPGTPDYLAFLLWMDNTKNSRTHDYYGMENSDNYNISFLDMGWGNYLITPREEGSTWHNRITGLDLGPMLVNKSNYLLVMLALEGALDEATALKHLNTLSDQNTVNTDNYLLLNVPLMLLPLVNRNRTYNYLDGLTEELRKAALEVKNEAIDEMANNVSFAALDPYAWGANKLWNNALFPQLNTEGFTWNLWMADRDHDMAAEFLNPGNYIEIPLSLAKLATRSSSRGVLTASSAERTANTMGASKGVYNTTQLADRAVSTVASTTLKSAVQASEAPSVIDNNILDVIPGVKKWREAKAAKIAATKEKQRLEQILGDYEAHLTTYGDNEVVSIPIETKKGRVYYTTKITRSLLAKMTDEEASAAINSEIDRVTRSAQRREVIDNEYRALVNLSDEDLFNEVFTPFKAEDGTVLYKVNPKYKVTENPSTGDYGVTVTHPNGRSIYVLIPEGYRDKVVGSEDDIARIVGTRRIPAVETNAFEGTDWTGWEDYRDLVWKLISEDVKNNGPLSYHLNRSGIAPEDLLKYIVTPEMAWKHSLSNPGLDLGELIFYNRTIRNFLESNPNAAMSYADGIIKNILREFPSFSYDEKALAEAMSHLEGEIIPKNIAKSIEQNLKEQLNSYVKNSKDAAIAGKDPNKTFIWSDLYKKSFDKVLDEIDPSVRRLFYLNMEKEYNNAFRDAGRGFLYVPVNTENFTNVLSHELGHLEDIIKSGSIAYKGIPLSETLANALNRNLSNLFKKAFNVNTGNSSTDNYLLGAGFGRGNSATEMASRGTQVLDFEGVRKGEELTVDLLKHAAKYYPKRVMDNNMTEFFKSIIDWDAATLWINTHSHAVTGATVGAGVAGAAVGSNARTNNNLNMRALGGLINTNNPILNYANNPHIGIPAVRYDYGGTLFEDNIYANISSSIQKKRRQQYLTIKNR